MIQHTWTGLLVLTTALTTGPAARPGGPFESVRLPEPSGAHAVGTLTHVWADETRRASYSSFPDDLRRVPVQLWFPAEEDRRAARAPYAALSSDHARVETNSTLWPAFARDVEACPLVLIIPGRGVERFAYTTIAEFLASHGYVVAAVDLPGIGTVHYPEGLVLGPDPAFRPPPGLMAGPYEEVDAFFERPTEIGTRDLAFALERIEALAQGDPSGRFTGRIDLTRVGVFGHSLGGRIAGALASRDARVRAYIAMEGIAPRDARLSGMTMPVAMLCSSGTLPYAIDNYQGLLDARRESAYLVELQGFGHNSVTDLPYVTPGSFDYEVDALVGLLTSVEIVQAFFDAHLKDEGGFAERCGALEHVLVTEHAAPEAR